jgi:predicted RNA-binding protein associated with RNAse of E/G family
MKVGDRITVHKRDAAGRETWSYPGLLLALGSSSMTIEAFYDRNEAEFHGLLLQPGDRFVETYYTDRGYNIFTVFAVDDGRLKGWYCNVTRPAVFRDGHIDFDDLALDLIVLPDGATAVVDVEEFEALDLPGSERERAQAALESLRSLAARREGPFARSG